MKATFTPVLTLEDKELPWLDASMCDAILSCPRWGLVRYVAGQQMPQKGFARELALEMGTALHQAFAAHHLHYAFHQMGCSLAMVHRGLVRVYDLEQVGDLLDKIEQKDAQWFCTEALLATGYYDDPDDKRRTLTNMETSFTQYLAAYNLDHSPPAIIGDEIAVELDVEFVIDTGADRFRYIGRVDKITEDYRVVDLKTSTGIKGKWAKQWETAHQPTGYMAAVRTMLNASCNSGEIIGLQVPLPKNILDGVQVVQIYREERQFDEWLKWVINARRYMRVWDGREHEAPMHTQYCFRYFSPCPMIDLCAASTDDYIEGMKELEPYNWNPHKARKAT